MVSSALVWVGAAFVSGGALQMLWEAVIYGLLTPTKKSPARKGDLESRRYLGRMIKLDLLLIACGAILFLSGLALR